MLTTLLSRTIVNHFAPALKNSLAIYIPSFLMLILFSQYEHRLTYTLAWLLSQTCIVLYLKTRSTSSVIRFFIFVTLTILLYLTGAGFFLIFAVMAILTEVLFRNKRTLAIFYLMFTLALPFLANIIFVLTLKSAFFYLLIPIYNYRPVLTPYVLYIYFPLFLILSKFGFSDWIARVTASRFYKSIAVAILFLLLVTAALMSFDSTMHRVLKVDYLAHQEKWQDLLTFVEHHPSDDILVAFQTNRALYHVGRLSSHMFAYNQNWGLSGLFLPDDARKFFSIQVSDLYWDIGFLNESEHWALEDHTNFLYSPRHLKRLADISLLKGNFKLADMCLNALEKSIIYRTWAQEQREFVDNPQLVERNSRFAYLKELNVKSDFIITPAFPEVDMERLLLQNPANRAAFEYMMADYLLTFRLGEFVNKLQTTSHVTGPYLPQHYQEALLVYLRSTQWQDRDLWGNRIQAQTANQFNHFMQILQQYSGNANLAEPELHEKYGDTYWYYSLYNNPSARRGQSQEN